MKELKIVVERIVRPICGAESRKNKMREELMGHLLTAHAEAVEKGVGEPVSYAVERLGDADALREELQDSVPKWERLGHNKLKLRLFGGLEAMTDIDRSDSLRVSIQSTLAIMIMLPLFIAPVILTSCAIKWTQSGMIEVSSLSKAFGVPTIMLGCAGVSLFAGTYLFRKSGLHKVIHASSGVSSIIKGSIGLVGYLAIIALFFAELVIVDGFWDISGANPTISDAIMIVVRQPRIYWCLAVAMVVVIYGLSAERRQYVEWGHLEIDE